MKKYLIALAIFSAAILAQIAPQPIDWRYSYYWDDPNPPGQVVRWTVYASNSVAVRMTNTTNRFVELRPLLNGAPAGVYILFNTAETELGDVSEPSTNKPVKWPGGDGRVRPGKGGQVDK